MDRLKTILVGIDFSEFSKAALRQAIRMARWNRAKVHLLHVIPSDVVDDLVETLPGDTSNLAQEVCSTASARLEKLLAETDSEGVETTMHVVIGTPFADLLRRSRDASADLLVLGVRGWTNRRVGAGTLATKCVRKAATKVLLAHPDQVERFEHVLACVDFSEVSARVVEQAVRLCSKDGAKLDVIHAYYPPWKVLHYMAPTRQASPDYQEEYKQLLRDRMENLLKPFEADTAKLEVECHLVESYETTDGIIDHQKQTGADLIVLGTHGRSGLRALLMGTTAEKVLQETKCSVLALKPEGFDFDVG